MTEERLVVIEGQGIGQREDQHQRELKLRLPAREEINSVQLVGTKTFGGEVRCACALAAFSLGSREKGGSVSREKEGD